jgi:flagellar export protein FliJ
MKDAKRLGRLIVVRERLLSVRQGELAEAAAALVEAEAESVRVASYLASTVEALTGVGEVLPDELALRAASVRAALEEQRRAEQQVSERAAERDASAARAFEAKKDVRVLEELEKRVVTAERRAEARQEQSFTDETAAARPRRQP